VNIVLPAALHN